MQKIRHMSKKLDIVLLYLSNYFLSFSGREISRRIKVSPQTAHSMLKSLVKDRLMVMRTVGKNKMFSLNKDNFRTRVLIQMAEIYEANNHLNNFELNSIVSTLIEWAETIIVFGSFAQERQKEESDLDLIVINGNKEKIRKIRQQFAREINIEFVTWKQFERSKTHLMEEIKKSHLIYGNVFKVISLFGEWK